MRRTLPLRANLLIPAASLLVVLPLILHGCSCGHDFDFHLTSWMEAAAQFKAGNLHPAWAFSPAWNAGEPRFVFYPPISWTLGAVFGVILPWTSAPVVYTWFALAVAGLAMYSLARALKASETISLLAAIVYLANPYMLFTAYERTAYAELLAAAWIPLLLAAILRDQVRVARVAIPVGLLWLTNAPAAVMGCYTLALLAMLRLGSLWIARRSDVRVAMRECAALAGRIVAGLAIGLGVAAFYILPAAYERRWVQISMATIQGMRIEDNFLFHHTSDALHDAVLHTASLIAVGVLTATLGILSFTIVRSVLYEQVEVSDSPSTGQTAVSIMSIAVVIGLLLTPISESLWHILPEMAFLQFPWRLTAVLSAVMCVGLALAMKNLSLRLPLVTLAGLSVVFAMSWSSATTFTQPCDDEDNVAARLAVFNNRTGTDPTDEYTPGNADNDALSHTNPPFWLAASADEAAPASGTSVGPAPMHLTLAVLKESILVLNLREYPAWQVRLNGAQVTDRVERADGLLAIPLHPDGYQIEVLWVKTWDRKLGEGISVFALCAVLATLGLGRLVRPRAPTPPVDARSRIIEG